MIRRGNWRRGLVLLCVLAQLLVLGAMAGKREWILAYGQEIYLRTAPLDPRDPFRGDFVRLDYPLSVVPAAQQRGSVAEHRQEKGYPVYAVLRRQSDDLYELDYLTDEEPASGGFMRGRLEPDWRTGQSGAVRVRYGIEQYFVEQGRGREIEQRRGRRGELQVPMEVQVALGSDGTAVIKDYRWSALGIQLELLRVNRRGADNTLADPALPLSPLVRVSLENVSAEPLALADPGEHCGFSLEAVSWASDSYTPAYDCSVLPVPDSAPIVLAPGARYSVELDLSDPRWHLSPFRGNDEPGRAVEIGALSGPVQFRLVYRSPEQAGLVAAARQPVWRGQLPTQAFNAVGRLD